MSSAYPVIWALKHAPVQDRTEKLILFALADHGDPDGCNAYPSAKTIARIAMCDEGTVKHRLPGMVKRRLIRFQQGPPPQHWTALRRDRRPKIYEVMIPASFWSAVQLEEIDAMRADREPFGDEVNSMPMTGDIRPDIAPAPARKSRSDKGKKNPARGRQKKAPASENSDRDVSETPRENDAIEDANGVFQRHDTGCFSNTGRGVSETPNPPLIQTSPDGHSSPPTSPSAEGTGNHTEPDDGREDEAFDNQPQDATPSTGTTGGNADRLLDQAVAAWPRDQRAPGARDRGRLVERIAAELEAGGDERMILHELTRDMGSVRKAVAVMLGDRTATIGWGRPADPRPDDQRYVPPGLLPLWCGGCDERVRQMWAGPDRMQKCPMCHPDSVKLRDGTGLDEAGALVADEGGCEDIPITPEQQAEVERMQAEWEQAKQEREARIRAAAQITREQALKARDMARG